MTTVSRYLSIAASAVALTSLAACGGYPNAPGPQYSGGYQTSPVYQNQQVGTEFGRVSNIEYLQGRAQSQTFGAGALVGAVVGGLLGNQVGKGSGRAAATAVGAIGGAVAGNSIEGRNNRSDEPEGYRLSVQLDQGGVRVYDVPTPGDLRIGDRVRLYNGQISRQ